MLAVVDVEAVVAVSEGVVVFEEYRETEVSMIKLLDGYVSSWSMGNSSWDVLFDSMTMTLSLTLSLSMSISMCSVVEMCSGVPGWGSRMGGT